jgi:hypothetical protein
VREERCGGGLSPVAGEAVRLRLEKGAGRGGAGSLLTLLRRAPKEKQDSLIVYKSWRRRDGRSDADRRDASTRGLAPYPGLKEFQKMIHDLLTT